MTHRILIIVHDYPPADLARQLQWLLDDPGLAPRLSASVPAVRSTKAEMRDVVSVFSRLLPA